MQEGLGKLNRSVEEVTSILKRQSSSIVRLNEHNSQIDLALCASVGIRMVKDLVCGMDVDEKTAKWKSEYKGKTYYFCASGCKQKFDKNPEKYVK